MNPLALAKAAADLGEFELSGAVDGGATLFETKGAPVRPSAPETSQHPTELEGRAVARPSPDSNATLMDGGGLAAKLQIPGARLVHLPAAADWPSAPAPSPPPTEPPTHPSRAAVDDRPRPSTGASGFDWPTVAPPAAAEEQQWSAPPPGAGLRGSWDAPPPTPPHGLDADPVVAALTAARGPDAGWAEWKEPAAPAALATPPAEPPGRAAEPDPAPFWGAPSAPAAPFAPAAPAAPVDAFGAPAQGVAIPGLAAPSAAAPAPAWGEEAGPGGAWAPGAAPVGWAEPAAPAYPPAPTPNTAAPEAGVWAPGAAPGGWADPAPSDHGDPFGGLDYDPGVGAGHSPSPPTLAPGFGLDPGADPDPHGLSGALASQPPEGYVSAPAAPVPGPAFGAASNGELPALGPSDWQSAPGPSGVFAPLDSAGSLPSLPSLPAEAPPAEGGLVAPPPPQAARPLPGGPKVERPVVVVPDGMGVEAELRRQSAGVAMQLESRRVDGAPAWVVRGLLEGQAQLLVERLQRAGVPARQMRAEALGPKVRPADVLGATRAALARHRRKLLIAAAVLAVGVVVAGVAGLVRGLLADREAAALMQAAGPAAPEAVAPAAPAAPPPEPGLVALDEVGYGGRSRDWWIERIRSLRGRARSAPAAQRAEVQALLELETQKARALGIELPRE